MWQTSSSNVAALKKGTVLGEKILDDVLLASLLKAFRNGVKVNAIDLHCHSEYLPKAIRKDKQSYRYIVNVAERKKFHYAATCAVRDQFRDFQPLRPFVESGLHRADGSPSTVENQDAFTAADGSQKNLSLTSKSAVAKELFCVLLRDYIDIFFQEEVKSGPRTAFSLS